MAVVAVETVCRLPSGCLRLGIFVEEPIVHLLVEVVARVLIRCDRFRRSPPGARARTRPRQTADSAPRRA